MIATINVDKTAQSIKSICKEKEVTPRELAEQMCLASEKTVYKWFSGTAIPSIDNFILLASILKLRIDDILVVDNGTAEDILIQSLFGDDVSITDDIPQASNYNAVEDAIRVYLRDYVITNESSLALAFCSDTHCLMTYTGVSDGADIQHHKVFRVDFNDRTLMADELMLAIKRLRSHLPIDNIMMLVKSSGLHNDGSYGKVVVHREDGELVFLDPYDG